MCVCLVGCLCVCLFVCVYVFRVVVLRVCVCDCVCLNLRVGCDAVRLLVRVFVCVVWLRVFVVCLFV